MAYERARGRFSFISVLTWELLRMFQYCKSKGIKPLQITESLKKKKREKSGKIEKSILITRYQIPPLVLHTSHKVSQLL